MRNAKATVLIGVTAKRGLFDEEILRQMAANDPRPVILALSNPTTKSECTAEEALAATDGRALIATGSPFAPVRVGEREVGVSQCNNLYMFPGVGLGALVSQASKVTDRMFICASKALAMMVSEAELEKGLLLPGMEAIREVAYTVAQSGGDRGARLRPRPAAQRRGARRPDPQGAVGAALLLLPPGRPALTRRANAIRASALPHR